MGSVGLSLLSCASHFEPSVHFMSLVSPFYLRRQWAHLSQWHALKSSVRYDGGGLRCNHCYPWDIGAAEQRFDQGPVASTWMRRMGRVLSRHGTARQTALHTSSWSASGLFKVQSPMKDHCWLPGSLEKLCSHLTVLWCSWCTSCDLRTSSRSPTFPSS